MVWIQAASLEAGLARFAVPLCEGLVEFLVEHLAHCVAGGCLRGEEVGGGGLEGGERVKVPV